MRNPILLINEIAELYIRKNFEILQKYFDDENQLLGFKHVEFSVDAAVVNYKIPHQLGYVPRDLIRTRKTGAGSVTFNRHLFDTENIDITTTGAAKVRLFAGTYRTDENTGTDAAATTETWT